MVCSKEYHSAVKQCSGLTFHVVAATERRRSRGELTKPTQSASCGAQHHTFLCSPHISDFLHDFLHDCFYRLAGCDIPYHTIYLVYHFQDSDPDKFDRAKLVEVLTAPYIEDSGDGIVALDPHALKKLFTTTSSLLEASCFIFHVCLLLCCRVIRQVDGPALTFRSCNCFTPKGAAAVREEYAMSAPVWLASCTTTQHHARCVLHIGYLACPTHVRCIMDPGL